MTAAGVPRVRFSPDVFWQQRVGGVSRYFLELHRGLLERSIDSVILAGLHGNDLVRGQPQVRGLHLGSLGRRRAVHRLSGAIDAVWGRAWARARPAGAVLHATWYPEHVPGRRPLVTTVHDMIQELHPDLATDSAVTSRRKRRWCAAADRIFTVSETTRTDLIELFSVDPAKVVVTHLGVRRVAPSRQPPALGGRPYLLYVGDRHSPYKNFSRLIDALAHAEIPDDLGLVCFGGGVPTEADQRAFVTRGLSTRVGFVQGDDASLAALYVGAQALVYPSLYEGFGLPPLEAMQYGCPVVCASAGSLPEVLADAAAMFDPTDAGALAATVADVVHDEGLRRVLVTRGRERSRRFTWDDTVARTLAAYRELVGT